ncbi:hypothetical protein [Mycobacterium sp. E1747]|nr:hypothetical protein [Mycobacterium sp. E1747]
MRISLKISGRHRFLGKIGILARKRARFDEYRFDAVDRGAG